jgi:DNA-binding transcriptional regulator YhcF (GntR family)
MNYRLLNIPSASKERPVTARYHVVTVLTQEIFDNPCTDTFPIESEHQLCRRFGISRVTVRLALADLEHRGLIYRKHGKDTFAHGRSTRIQRHIGVLIKSPQTTENRPLAEILRGVQTVLRPLRAAIILISQSPEEWRPELGSALSGVIVMPENVVMKELESLQRRNLPFLLFGPSDLPGPRIPLSEEADFFTAGQRAAEALIRAYLAGEPATNIAIEPIAPRNQSAGNASMIHCLGGVPLK